MSQISSKRAATSPLNSEFNKRPKLGLSVAKLEELNKEVNAELKAVNPIPTSSPECVRSDHLVLVFREVAKHTPNINANWTTCKGLVERLSTSERQEFDSLWVEARKEGDWGKFANHFLLLVAPTSGGTQELDENLSPRLSTMQSKKATMESWDITYVGNAHHLLYQHIAYYSAQAGFYAKYTSIVQSSGMGKSRTIDEFSKNYLVVPLNLRKSSDGFPPPDDSVRDWLLQSKMKIEAFNRAGAFLCALFITLLRYLQKIDDHIGVPLDGTLPAKFRHIMTEGQEFSQQGAPRRKFYADVLDLANKIWVPALPTIPPASPKLSLATIGDANTIKYNLRDAIGALMNFLIPDFNVENSNTPVLILSFDEAHPLAETQDDPHSGRWSNFSELRRALKVIDLYPCFSLFLSTTGKVNQFMPLPENDNSNRIEKGQVQVIPPFCELGFDQLAEKVILNETTMDEIASLKFMATLSRPLFAARYIKGDAEVKAKIVSFALEKLLCRPFPTPNDLTQVEKLACISVRIPLEFSLGYSHSREMERILVEKHLRVCLQVNPGFETPITIAPSEPLLAEASCFVMNNTKFDVPRALREELEDQGLDKGNRGELTAMVLCLLARDAAARRLSNRVIPICDFIQELLVPEASSNIFLSKPVQARVPEEADKTFRATFGKSKMFFNHFVKLHDDEIINRGFLWVLIARGAAGICTDYQIGIDIIIPFLFWDNVLRQENVSAIFIQCKNNVAFQGVPRQYLFDMMHPYHIHFFEEKETTPLPVIRMVFALGSPKSEVVVLSRPERVQPLREGAFKASFQADKYTAFDIWCAGATQKVFCPIKEDIIFQELLHRFRPFPDVFENKMSKDLQNATRSMNPAAGSHPAHYCNYTLSK